MKNRIAVLLAWSSCRIPERRQQHPLIFLGPSHSIARSALQKTFSSAHFNGTDGLDRLPAADVGPQENTGGIEQSCPNEVGIGIFEKRPASIDSEGVGRMRRHLSGLIRCDMQRMSA
ncbi:hypothetical protein [Desulfosarcina ovata]|uniref:hypothetical protein n=1 Tax=Desulfosarcina ovata TaxID=83564 RepID=UPI0012D32D13|nr:hypothetical protein [Desulfosarcina ovata]